MFPIELIGDNNPIKREKMIPIELIGDRDSIKKA